MTVNKEITRLEHSSVKLTLTVGKDDVRSEYDGLLAEYSKNIQMPGFRKGKVPREVLVRKFGDALKGEALGRIVEKSVGEVLDDETFAREDKPLPYSQPQIQDEKDLALDLEKDFQFAVVYDVLPKLTVGKWQGLEIEVPDIAITDEDLDRELEKIRDRNAIVMDKDEGQAAAKDDVVTINYCELGDSGEVLPNSERQDFAFTLGSGLNIYKIDDDLVGMKKGDTREITKTYAEDAEDKTFAGQTKKLRVDLTALKIKKLPDLDDDFAQDVDEKFKTFADLKQSIQERLDKDLDRRVREIKVSKLLEKIMETTPVEIPESMTRLELDSRWRNLARRFNTDSDGLYKMMGNSPNGVQGILDGWKPDANRALHSRLIVETLMEELKFEASDEEVEKEIETQAEAGGATIEEFKKYYEQEQMREYLKEDIKERKLFDRLLQENTIKPGKKEKYIDLISNNG
ncbi:trigger factor [Leadbettera azotonutricia]|uniref:Trigger factor n=1 Tax=Leadbettera azotonutricia (strain ATCC BAA-888 / DSM 13862 / ZAS-9) TaxID=545695 RepID=F5YA96_LEAAZ|nr:trigger factor [Leadbettera azotonutricia]AEF80809.1 trigger factor [Leadbettera azotonutricia ZAS-9]